MNTTETTPSAVVRQLPGEETWEAAALLSRAFEGYPMIEYLFAGQPPERRERFTEMFAALIGSRFIRRWPVLGVWSGTSLAGVAVITSPDDTPGEEQADLLLEGAGRRIGEQASTRFWTYAEACDAGLPAWPHHYLGILGVDPRFRGRQYGRALLQATQSLSRKHPVSQGVVLNTEAPANLAYYAGSGFECVHAEPLDEITTWTMIWRRTEPFPAATGCPKAFP